MRLSNNINGAWGALATGRGFALGCRYARDHFPDEFGRRRTYWPRPGRNFLRSLLSTAASRRGPWLAKCSLPRISVHWDLRKSCFAIYLDLPVLMNRIHPKLLIRHNRHSNTCGMDVIRLDTAAKFLVGAFSLVINFIFPDACGTDVVRNLATERWASERLGGWY